MDTVTRKNEGTKKGMIPMNEGIKAELLSEPKLEIKEKRSYRFLWAAFFLPLALMYLIYIGMEVWPFGECSVLVLDLNGQYVYYFEEFRRILHGEADLLYSWTRTLGGEFLGIFAYYLCSPFTLIAAILPAAWMTESLLIIILSKVGMCGVTMALYLTHSRKANPYTATLFGTMYALCAYGVIQSMNTMWIDAMYLFPIVILGVERLIRDGKPVLYTLTLFALLMTNYYIGFMTCIFLVLYFFYAYATYKHFDVKSFLSAGARFALYSLLAAAMAAVLLIPAYYGLTFGKTEFQNTNYEFLQRFDFLDFLVKFLPASYDTVRPEGLPVVYSGMLSLIFAPLYFLVRDIPKKQKVMAGLLLVCLCMSMNASTVDIFWHGLSKPNWLNYRYSFMLCFFVIALAADAFAHFAADREGASAPKLSMQHVLTVGLVLFLAILLIQKQDYEFIDDIGCIWLSLAFLGAYLAILHPLGRGEWSTTAKTVLLAAVALELFSSGLSNLVALDNDVVFSNRQPYADFMAGLRPIVEKVEALDDGLYRMEKTHHRKVNDNMALGIKGISHSSSDLNASVIKLLGEMGYASRSHWTKYLGETPVADSLIGIKYVISDKDLSPTYTKVAETDKYGAYENPYAMSILYTADEALLSYDTESTTTPFVRLNEIVTRVLGETETVELFKPIEYTNIETYNITNGFTTGHNKYSKTDADSTAALTYYLTVPTTDEVYVFFPSKWAREVDLSLNGIGHGTYFGNETRRIVSLGSFMAGEPISLQLSLKQTEVYIDSTVDYFYYLDTALYEEVMARLQAQNAVIEDYDDTHINGTFTLNEGQELLLTTIPYDEGWHVTVDGVELPITRALGALAAINVSSLGAGEHTFAMRYMPSCYVYGFFLSIGGACLFVLCLILRKLFAQYREKRAALMPAAELDVEAATDALLAEMAEDDLTTVLDAKTLAGLPQNTPTKEETDSVLALFADPEDTADE